MPSGLDHQITRNDLFFSNVAPDGQSFLVKLSNPDSWVSEIHVVRKWFEVLKARAGEG